MLAPQIIQIIVSHCILRAIIDIDRVAGRVARSDTGRHLRQISVSFRHLILVLFELTLNGFPATDLDTAWLHCLRHHPLEFDRE